MTSAADDLQRYSNLALRHAVEAQRVQDLDGRCLETPWWSGRLRRSIARARKAAASEASDLETRLKSDPRIRDLVVVEAINKSVLQLRESVSHRNAYHREVLGQLDDLAAQVLDRIASDRNWTLRGRIPYVAALPMTQVPAFADQLTHGHIAEVIRNRVEFLAAIADDDEMLEVTDGETYAVVQHRASGLRARFTVDPNAPGLSLAPVGQFGTVYSKPYRIESLSNLPDPGSWQWYVGLGIGTKIYRRGGQLLPEVRWRSSTMTSAAAGARGHLHQENPYVWAWSECDRCRGTDLSNGWSNMNRTQIETLHR